MNKKVHYERVTEPTVFVTQNRQRVKQYNKSVYLKDGDEFELELFNPLSYKVLAKIKLNGNYLESGIVLRPGERVFLERHINEAKKFVFEIYSVDKSDPNVQRAIADNGDVEVGFYSESFNQPVIYSNNTSPYIYHDPPNWNPPIWDQNPSIFYCSSGHTTGDVTFKGGDHVTFTANAGNFNFSDNFENSVQCCNSVQETGRVEKGSHSDQMLEYDSTSFNSWTSWTKSWKILPMSQKAYVKEEISVYCTNCGAKRKKSSFKFCPTCGTKF